jgi:proline racemase
MSMTVRTIEVHAEGEPGRVILDADQWVRGSTITERFAYCRDNLDGLRHLLLHEPRGYPATCAVFVLPATDPASDAGIVVLEQGGFTPMSGSNTMCAVTGMLDAGIVEMVEPVTTVTLETAVGVITAEARCENGRVVDVTVRSVPAFVVALDHPLDVPGLGSIPVDVVFGGQFFVQVRAEVLGVDLDRKNARELLDLGTRIKAAALAGISVRHPLNPDIDAVGLVMIYADPLEPVDPDDPGTPGRNTVILPGALDRSPCGTGTCGRMAARVARGELAIGDEFVHESILGTRFIGRPLEATEVAGIPAIRPSITGRTFITGRAEWVLDPADPFPAGYTLPDFWPPT